MREGEVSEVSAGRKSVFFSEDFCCRILCRRSDNTLRWSNVRSGRSMTSVVGAMVSWVKFSGDSIAQLLLIACHRPQSDGSVWSKDDARSEYTAISSLTSNYA